MREKPFLRTNEHRTEEFADLRVKRGQLLMFGGREIAAVQCEIQARVGLGLLTIALSQFGKEMRFVTPLGPCFSQVKTDRSRGAPNLTRECKSLLRGKSFAQSKHSHGNF